ncbi:MAG TPA: 5-formyltetrahydrofolate cyclo-ligase [Gammaproteobacteria bacterium]|nr:5-formyltetrahydrofolate cyclo-ligase [Gammaproteobacteria bacterium]
MSSFRTERRLLRQRIRAERRSMSAAERAVADRAIRAHIRKLPAFRRARHVALFLPFDGEPTLTPLIESAHPKHWYAPVIMRKRMRFARIHTGAQLAHNFFGILEPHLGAPIDARRLDLVLTPLVAFDGRGVRVGVGRGYYDRCFRFLRGRDAWQRPKLLGVAYELQHLPYIETQDWDIPLWGAVTEAGVRRFEIPSAARTAA